MRWLLLGAAVSAVLGLCCILLCRNYLLYCLLTHFLINTLMTVICFGRCDRSSSLRTGWRCIWWFFCSVGR